MNSLFLDAMRCALKNQQVTWQQEITTAQWEQLFELSRTQRVLPMIYNAVFSCPSARRADKAVFAAVRKQVFQQVLIQVQKDQEFEQLYRFLEQEGLRPAIVKGMVCRTLYPNPEYRGSGDEDLLIGPLDFDRCHRAMLDFGMTTTASEENLTADYEIPYRKPGTALYVELHRYLFPPESEAYGNLNSYFLPDKTKTIPFSVNDFQVTTLNETSHLLYLICHAYKHFIHSGVGIRQLCDIALFARAYSHRIRWDYVYQKCLAFHGTVFVAALFRIAKEHLDISIASDDLPQLWKACDIDANDLLQDMLSGGVYGQADESRLHSSNITLTAVANAGEKASLLQGMKESLFPSREQMVRKYPYLKEKPALLPLAWAQRICTFGANYAKSGRNVSQVVSIGKARVALLEKYQMIE